MYLIGIKKVKKETQSRLECSSQAPADWERQGQMLDVFYPDKTHGFQNF